MLHSCMPAQIQLLRCCLGFGSAFDFEAHFQITCHLIDHYLCGTMFACQMLIQYQPSAPKKKLCLQHLFCSLLKEASYQLLFRCCLLLFMCSWQCLWHSVLCLPYCSIRDSKQLLGQMAASSRSSKTGFSLLLTLEAGYFYDDCLPHSKLSFDMSLLTILAIDHEASTSFVSLSLRQEYSDCLS